MNVIKVKDAVAYAFMEFKALETMQFFFFTDPKKAYQKVPQFKLTLLQGTTPDTDVTKLYNAIKLSTGEGVYVVADVCVHPMDAHIELSARLLDSIVVVDSQDITNTTI